MLARAYREASRDDAFLYLTSPANFFELVSAPVQIHQGAADRTTPPKWAEAIRDGLQAAAKPVEYFSYAGQGHAFEGESWDLFMQRITDFFDLTLKGDNYSAAPAGLPNPAAQWAWTWQSRPSGWIVTKGG
jgi:dipeptidyl aminopeptidase/acylaminoacyl peptidase